jgi:hypothetical protein
MAYSGQTDKYQIPYPQQGDIIQADEEKRVVEIIENQILGGIRSFSGGNGIIREGLYTSINNGDGTFTINLIANNPINYPAIEAYISQIYVKSVSTISWTTVPDDSVNYLFINLVESSTLSSRQNGQVATTFSTSPTIPSDALILAQVTIASSVVTITTSVTGRIDIPLLSDHIADNIDPHGALLEQTTIVTSGIDVLNSGVVRGVFEVQGVTDLAGLVQVHSPLYIDSGIPVDGVDVSTLVPLLDGSNADSLHTHSAGGLLPDFEVIGLAPRYPNTIESGAEVLFGTLGGFVPSRLETVRDTNRNAYRYIAGVTGRNATLVTSHITPGDFSVWSGIQLDYKTTSGLVDNEVNFFMTDKDSVSVGVINGQELRSDDWTTAQITISGGQFVAGEQFTTQVELRSTSGIPSYVGDFVLKYIPAV